MVVRDMRNPGWLWMRNEIIDEYAAQIGTSGLAMYAVLCRFADNGTQTCFPAIQTLADKLGVSLPTARAALTRLQEFGLISVELRFDENGRQQSNEYALLAVPTRGQELCTHGGQETDTLTRPIQNYNTSAESTQRGKPSASVYPIQDAVGTEDKREEGARAPVDDTGARGEREVPVSFPGWLEAIRGTRNRTALLVRMHRALYPDHDPPEFGHMGRVAKQVGGAANLARLLWEANTRPPVGDVLAYIVRAQQAQGKGKGREQGVDGTQEEFYEQAMKELKLRGGANGGAQGGLGGLP